MLSVTLNTGRVGDTFAQQRGDTIEVDDAEALRMLAAGQCRPADAAAQKQLDQLRADKKPRAKN